MKRLFEIMMFLFAFILLVGCDAQSLGADNPVTVRGEMKVYFFDIDQGDATLLKGDDFSVLIDAGRHDRKDVVEHLKSVGVTELDVVVGTHPHGDHIGQIANVLESFPVKEVWLSGNEHSSKTYERTIDAILASDAEYYEPRAGETFDIGSLVLEVINPTEINGDFHDGCISIRARFGETEILFTGDAEKETEEKMIERGHDLRADVFQLGHHGSSTSNSREFLEAIDPDVAIYSAGRNNDYGHPHREVVQLLDELEITTYGTDINGTIVLTSNGKTYEIRTEFVSQVQEQTVEAKQEISNCIDINTATAEELEKIVHIGRERVDDLISLRPYQSVKELTKINGIGKGRIKDIIEEKLACVQ
ncbi:MAG TPA: MBL fold metallo-hydrolase [Bacilli bacterium]|nr:MBL fold metallo-hydrolase [Bacilli bacterium]